MKPLIGLRSIDAALSTCPDASGVSASIQGLTSPILNKLTSENKKPQCFAFSFEFPYTFESVALKVPENTKPHSLSVVSCFM
jgi:hypothetical protein